MRCWYAAIHGPCFAPQCAKVEIIKLVHQVWPLGQFRILDQEPRHGLDHLAVKFRGVHRVAGHEKEDKFQMPFPVFFSYVAQGVFAIALAGLTACRAVQVSIE